MEMHEIAAVYGGDAELIPHVVAVRRPIHRLLLLLGVLVASVAQQREGQIGCAYGGRGHGEERRRRACRRHHLHDRR